MKAALSKFGLSDTKHELKLLTPKTHKRKYHENIYSKKSQHSVEVKPFQIESSSKEKDAVADVREMNLLQIIIHFLSTKQKQECKEEEHENNLIQYLCLEQNCPKKIGCSHCFLFDHKNHLKVESKVCLRDLKQLSEKIKNFDKKSMETILSQKSKIKEKIETQINLIKQSFERQLDVISQRLFNNFQQMYIQKMKEFEKSSQIQTEYEMKQKHKRIIEKFSSVKTQQQQDTNKKFQSACATSVKRKILFDKETEENLLVKISRIKISEMEAYLNAETSELEKFVKSFSRISEYLMKTQFQVDHMMIQATREIPNSFYYSDRNMPQLLKRNNCIGKVSTFL